MIRSTSPRIAALRRAAASHGDLHSARVYRAGTRVENSPVVAASDYNNDEDEDDAGYKSKHSLVHFDLSSLEEMRNVSPTPPNSDDEGDGDEETGAEERTSPLSSPRSVPLPVRTSSLPPERRSDTRVLAVSIAAAAAAAAATTVDAQRSAFMHRGRSRSMLALQSDVDQTNVYPHLATPLTDAEIAQLREKAAWAREVSTGRIPPRVLTLSPRSLIVDRCVLYAVELESFYRPESVTAQMQLVRLVNCLCCARAAMVAYFKQLKRYAKLSVGGSTCYTSRPSIAFHLSCSEGLRRRLLANHSDLARFDWTTYPDERRESDAEGVALTCEHVVHLTQRLCSFQHHCKKRAERTERGGGGGGGGTRQLCKFFIFHSDAALCERLHKTFRRRFPSNDTFTLHNPALIERHFSDLLDTLELCTDALNV